MTLLAAAAVIDDARSATARDAATTAPAATKTRRLNARRLTGTAWWREYLALAAGRCAYCHAPDDPLTVEHVQPLCAGGANSPENLLPVCSECNHAKGQLTLAEFVAEWTFPAAEGIPHPLGQIVDGEWVWSPAGLRVQHERQRAARAEQPQPTRASRLMGALRRPVVRRTSFGDLAYAAAYDA